MLASLVRVVMPVLGGGALYTAWLAAALVAVRRPASPMPLALVITAPVVTAFGFGLGTLLGDRLTHRLRRRFLQAYLWPLAGCTVGALVVYPFGPMLIVFGMFAFGTGAVVAREVQGVRKPRIG